GTGPEQFHRLPPVSGPAPRKTPAAEKCLLLRRSHMPIRQFRVAPLTVTLQIAALCLVALPAHADEWQPITQEELKMTTVPEAPGAPAVILYRQVDRDDVRNGH